MTMDTPNHIPDIPQEKFTFVQLDQEIVDSAFETEPIGYFKDALIRLRKNKASVVAFYIILVISSLAIFGQDFNPYTFRQQNPERTNMPPRVPGLEKLGIMDGTTILRNRRLDSVKDPNQFPEGSVIRVFNQRTVRGVEMVDVKVDYYKLVGAEDEYYWLGTDYLGRDLWTRLCRGTRVSLIIALVSVVTNIFIGIVYGAIAGYYGGKTDMYMMRVCEIINAFPQIVVVTMFILFFGTGMFSIIMALVIRGWIPTARLIRAQFLRFKNREYVLAARTLGVGDLAIIFRHILPNSIGPIITRAMITIPGAIFSESFLAFVGLGLKAPEPSIGILLSQGQKVLLQHPYQAFAPSLMISVLMIAFNLFANGLRDAFDPTLRGQE
ncbi:MAG: ABC transporter permease [Bacillota bacterium]|jgi:oligopeptide transport system permease protein